MPAAQLFYTARYTECAWFPIGCGGRAAAAAAAAFGSTTSFFLSFFLTLYCAYVIIT